MKKGHIAASALALVFASSLMALPTWAQSDVNTPKAAASEPAPSASSDAQAIMKFSEDGNRAIHDVNTARIAIFDGNPEAATDMLTKAKDSVAKAEKDAPTFAVTVTTKVGGHDVGTTSQTDKSQLVPVDAQLVLADDFVETPEKKQRIKNANEFFKNGKKKEALEELRLGDIAVIYKRVFMPIESTAKHIDQAIALMKDHKYYEANLALKAISDSLTVDSVKLNEVPKS